MTTTTPREYTKQRTKGRKAADPRRQSNAGPGRFGLVARRPSKYTVAQCGQAFNETRHRESVATDRRWVQHQAANVGPPVL